MPSPTSGGDPQATWALPLETEHWSLTTLRETLIKIGAKIVRHGRYVAFQSAEMAVPRELFRSPNGPNSEARIMKKRVLAALLSLAVAAPAYAHHCQGNRANNPECDGGVSSGGIGVLKDANRRAPGPRHLPNGRLLAPDCAST